MKPLIWSGCYDNSWHEIITAESFAHPAKFSRGLIRRIVEHGFKQGYWKAGDTVGDPFGGIGTGGIVCAYRGLHWLGVELEPRFVEMAQANFERHRARLERLGSPIPMIRQGDSRRFSELVEAIVTSPPYGTREDGSGIAVSGDTTTSRLGRSTLAAVVTSPPFTTDQPCHSQSQLKDDIQGRAKRDQSMQSDNNIQKLSPGSLDAVISSPPYAKSLRRQQDGIDWEKAQQNGPEGEGHGKGKSCHADYGSTVGQIANLSAGPIEGVITSPPYADIAAGAGGLNTKPAKASGQQSGRKKGASQSADQRYGKETGQIAALHDESYWSAMAQVYAACFRALKPGGVMAVVVKDYVKKRQRVRLCDDTVRLLEYVGFTTIERVHAMLVEEHAVPDLFHGPNTVKRTERKSFFRRLAEKKGSPPIDYEEVIFCRKEQP